LASVTVLRKNESESNLRPISASVEVATSGHSIATSDVEEACRQISHQKNSSEEFAFLVWIFQKNKEF
jgi:hypothetical protein